jgi:Zn-dependent protease/CBS domain-containing protein
VKGIVRLGRIAGVPVAAHWSVLVILFLIVDTLATTLLPDAVPDRSALAYWAVAAAAGVLFVAALLGHELAHAVLARRYGLPVHSITLWMLGGMARLEGQPPTARADLAVAAAGPLTSMLAGGLFAMLAWLAGLLAAPGLIVAGLAWLAGVNLLLAVFNLLPGAPLDGGRVLRALVWLRTGDRRRAASVATTAGLWLGGLLVVGGIVEALATGDLIGGLWFMLLGWFLRSAARAEASSERTAELPAGLTVADVMTRDVPALPAYLTLDRAAALVADSRHEAYPVVAVDGTPLGTVTADEIAAVPPALRPTTRVGNIFTPVAQVATVGPDEPLTALLAGSRSDRPVLVLAGGRLLGVLTPADVAAELRRAALRERAPAG